MVKGKNIVKVFKEKKQPKIIVLDIPLTENYYRTTKIMLENKNNFYINWNTKEDFKRGFAQLQRHYKFNQQDVIDINTKTHRYHSTTFIAKGFKP